MSCVCVCVLVWLLVDIAVTVCTDCGVLETTLVGVLGVLALAFLPFLLFDLEGVAIAPSPADCMCCSTTLLFT